MGVAYAAIYDLAGFLSARSLRTYQREGLHYVDMARAWFPEVGLGLTTWEGEYQGIGATWLRWCFPDGRLLATGDEAAKAEGDRADAERQRADLERQRADRLAERLRSLGLEDV